MRSAYRPYTPLQALKPFAPDVWIVDGPEIGMRAAGLTLPFPTRMTIVRLPGERLWIHSPIELDSGLLRAIGDLGEVRFLIAPNTLHYWWIMDWKSCFPGATTYGVPDLEKKAKRSLSMDRVLDREPPPVWGGLFDLDLVESRALIEAVFFHRPSRTLVLTDLIENFEPARIHSRLLRAIIRLAGAADPDGKAPIDMRLSFLGHRRELSAVARHMIAWQPERIVVAHGRCYATNGVAQLRRAFRWAL